MNFEATQLTPFGMIVEPKRKNTHINDLDIAHLRDMFYQEQLIVLRGFDTFKHADDFSNYCEYWGEVSLWPFGKVLVLKEQSEPKDHIFDNNYVPLHWDGMYRPQVPEYQMFHCIQAPLSGEGGRTTFSNTRLVLKHASTETKERWHKITGSYQRKMAFYHSKIVSPVITKHPHKDISVIRYNEPPTEEKRNFLNPPELTFSGANDDTLDAFHRQLKRALYDPKNFYAHEWKTGDIVIADNFSLLHGREAFISNSPRLLHRVHVLSDPPFDNPGLESYE